jgi:hypothetical protein
MASHSRLQELLLDLAKALEAADVDHALIGGLALAPRGFPRGTKDVDFLIHEVQASWSNPSRLQDLIDIERLLGANRSTVDLDPCDAISSCSTVKKTSTEPLDWWREKADEALAAGDLRVSEPPPPPYPPTPRAGVDDLFEILLVIEGFGFPEPSREPIQYETLLL